MISIQMRAFAYVIPHIWPGDLICSVIRSSPFIELDYYYCPDSRFVVGGVLPTGAVAVHYPMGRRATLLKIIMKCPVRQIRIIVGMSSSKTGREKYCLLVMK